MKTILHLTGMHSLKYGGVERYLLELAKLARLKGYRTVLQYESTPHSAAYLHELESAGCDLAITSIGSSCISSVPRTLGLIGSIKPKIIQTHFVRGYVHLLLPLLAHCFGTKQLLAMIHGVQGHTRAWRRIPLNRYSRVIGVSQGVTRSLRAIGITPEIVSTHYLGLFGEPVRSESERDKYRNEFGIPKSAVVLACIAFDSQLKGVDILLEAIAGMSDTHPNLHLLIVGINPLTSHFPSDAVNLGIGKRTHWAGIRDEGWRLLNAADLYVQPSRSEAMPFAVMEAMALHLPVVGTKVGGLPEIIVNEKTGYLVDPTASSLSNGLITILEKQQDWATMGMAGYLRYQTHFRGEASANAFIEAYY